MHDMKSNKDLDPWVQDAVEGIIKSSKTKTHRASHTFCKARLHAGLGPWAAAKASLGTLVSYLPSQE